MGRRWQRKFVRRPDPTSPRVTMLLFGFILSIPIGSLFIGYSIGHYLMKPPRRMPDDQVVMDHYRLNHTQRNTRHLTTKLRGGLGNLMFLYASMYGMARANGLIPLIPDNHHLSSVFPFLWADTVNDPHPGTAWPKFWERNPNSFDKRGYSLNFMKNIELEGWYQSWHYFEPVRRDIREQFRFSADVDHSCSLFLREALVSHKTKYPWKDKNNNNNDIIIDNIINNNDNEDIVFVGIHVRRGDFIDTFNVERGYTTAPPGYFRQAMQYFSKKYKNAIFIVCTDDKKWTRANVGSATNLVVYSPYGSAAMDMCLLSKCNHTIMTVGTFGWWGAWLAGGETIYYKDFPSKGSPISQGFHPTDYYYQNWIPL